MDDKQWNAEIADACSQTRTFGWLTDNGYPTSGMSQKEGFTKFQLAPILEAYRKFRESRKDTPQQYYNRVWIKEHGSDPRGDWPFRFAEAYAAYLTGLCPDKQGEKAVSDELER